MEWVFVVSVVFMGVWQGVVMDSLKCHPGPPCLTLLRPAGGPPLKRPYRHFTLYLFGHPTPHADGCFVVFVVLGGISIQIENGNWHLLSLAFLQWLFSALFCFFLPFSGLSRFEKVS
jgi:hypothetical protein